MPFNSPNGPAGDPASIAVLVTPSDTVPLPFITTALWVGGAGNLAVVMSDASGANGGALLTVATTFSSVGAGQWMPLRVTQVMNTNTTATAIVAVKA